MSDGILTCFKLPRGDKGRRLALVLSRELDDYTIWLTEQRIYGAAFGSISLRAVLSAHAELIDAVAARECVSETSEVLYASHSHELSDWLATTDLRSLTADSTSSKRRKTETIPKRRAIRSSETQMKRAESRKNVVSSVSERLDVLEAAVDAESVSES